MSDTEKRPNKGGGKGGARRAGRQLAFQVLYGENFLPSASVEVLEKVFNETPAIHEQTTDKAQDFARHLVFGLHRKMDGLDEIIQSHSKHWKLSRIAKVELAILRLSLYEMLHTDIPLKVAINEGVELSKRFGDENSRNFINGILDAVARTIDKGEFGVEKKF